jgi:hypothetical protein
VDDTAIRFHLSVAPPPPSADGTRGDDRLDCRHSHHRRVPHDPIHALAFQYCLHERERHAGFGGWGYRVKELDVDAVADRRRDPRAKLVAASIEHGDLVSGCKSQHPGQVPGLV